MPCADLHDHAAEPFAHGPTMDRGAAIAPAQRRRAARLKSAASAGRSAMVRRRRPSRCVASPAYYPPALQGTPRAPHLTDACSAPVARSAAMRQRLTNRFAAPPVGDRVRDGRAPRRPRSRCAISRTTSRLPAGGRNRLVRMAGAHHRRAGVAIRFQVGLSVGYLGHARGVQWMLGQRHGRRAHQHSRQPFGAHRIRNPAEPAAGRLHSDRLTAEQRHRVDCSLRYDVVNCGRRSIRRRRACCCLRSEGVTQSCRAAGAVARRPGRAADPAPSCRAAPTCPMSSASCASCR